MKQFNGTVFLMDTEVEMMVGQRKLKSQDDLDEIDLEGAIASIQRLLMQRREEMKRRMKPRHVNGKRRKGTVRPR